MILLKNLVNNQSYSFTQKADISLTETVFFFLMDSFIHPSATPTNKNKHFPFKAEHLALLATERTLPQQQENPKRTSIFKNKM